LIALKMNAEFRIKNSLKPYICFKIIIMKVDQIIAKSIISSGAEIVTCVPGFGGTQVFQTYTNLTRQSPVFSFHEEVAFASALGAAVAGKRSAFLSKVHGLAKAANALTDSLYMGLNGAMLVFVFEDEQGSHSDNIMAAEPLLKGLRMPYSIPEKENLAEQIYLAFEKSATLKIPVARILSADIVYEDGEFIENNKVFQSITFKRDLLSHLVVPVFAGYQFKVMNAKIEGRNFENIEQPAIPEIPGGLPPDYAEYVKPYMPLMKIFSEIRGEIVFGDTGISTLFAFPPFGCVDACSYMGGSVAMALGASQAGYKNCWAVTGDFSFIAAGHLGLIEALSKNIPVKILIFKNDKAQTTGGQTFSKNLLNRILLGFGEFVTEINDWDDESVKRNLLQGAADADKIQIVVANVA